MCSVCSVLCNVHSVCAQLAVYAYAQWACGHMVNHETLVPGQGAACAWGPGQDAAVMAKEASLHTAQARGQCPARVCLVAQSLLLSRESSVVMEARSWWQSPCLCACGDNLLSGDKQPSACLGQGWAHYVLGDTGVWGKASSRWATGHDTGPRLSCQAASR